MTKKLDFIKPLLFSILFSQIFVQQFVYALDDATAKPTYRGRGTSCITRAVTILLGFISSGQAEELYKGETTYAGRQRFVTALTPGCLAPEAEDILSHVRDTATVEAPFSGSVAN